MITRMENEPVLVAFVTSTASLSHAAKPMPLLYIEDVRRPPAVVSVEGDGRRGEIRLG